ncbi:MAG TPA: YceI family protein [Salegentibacter sp.]|uniref:YceI family protein n=1 Tax=Salegentibacter sp. TaxID=1903072 RepID=UPI002F959675
MNKLLSKTFIIAFLGLAITGCKNENNKAKTGDAQDAREATLEAETFKVKTDESVIHWKGRKPTATHTGTIKLAEGSFKANDSTIESGRFVIDMKSIEVSDLKGKDRSDLEAHLKGTVKGKEGDFFNTEEYPEATFEITDITEENGQTMLSGNLTIKEETKNISFPVNITNRGDQVEISSNEFSIDRTNWKVNFGSKSVFDGLGDNFVYDDINLRLRLVAEKS